MALRRGICKEHGGVFHYQAARGRQPTRCGGTRPACDKADALVPRDAKPRSSENPSLPLAMAAKAQLEAVGWAVKGKGRDLWAEITASRGAETLIISWSKGQVENQNYSMEYLKPSNNRYPESSLGFDPNEMTDRELVQRISGMKVTWWNTLASATESAVVPGERVKVEHIFVGNGDEDNSKRIVTFVDRNAGGFRSFHVGALLKVG